MLRQLCERRRGRADDEREVVFEHRARLVECRERFRRVVAWDAAGVRAEVDTDWMRGAGETADARGHSNSNRQCSMGFWETAQVIPAIDAGRGHAVARGDGGRDGEEDAVAVGGVVELGDVGD